MDIDYNKLKELVPEEVELKELYPYLQKPAKLSYEILNGYIVLGIKSVNKHYTKSYYALCTDCLVREKRLELSICHGQKNQFLRKTPCGCVGKDSNFRLKIKSKVNSLIVAHSHISYLSHDEDRVHLLCGLHGEFSLKVEKFSGKCKLKYFCTKCYHDSIQSTVESRIASREIMAYTYPYPYDIEYTIGNTFKTQRGNTLTVVKRYGGAYIDVKCKDCKDVCKIFTSNLRVGQVPCSCSVKSKPQVVGNKVDTLRGNTLTVTKTDEKHLWVTCNICHSDTELWRDPIKVLRSTIHNGSSPCSCSNSCLYTKEQYKVRIGRALNAVPCYTEFRFPFTGKVILKRKVEIYCKVHNDWYYNTIGSLIAKEEFHCKLCEPSKTGFDLLKAGKLYIMIFKSLKDDSHVIKVGITNGKVRRRFKRILSKTEDYEGYVYGVLEFKSGQTCLDVENELKYLYANNQTGALKSRFLDGYTETFGWSLEVLDDLIKDLAQITGVYLPDTDTRWRQTPLIEGKARILSNEKY